MIISKTDIKFDVNLIKSDIKLIVNKYGWSNADQLCFNHPKYITDPIEKLHLGANTLWDKEKKKLKNQERDFSILNDELNGTYLEEIFNFVQKEYGDMGRFRAIKLKPKSCLSLHADFDNPRYHIPIEINENCFFVHFIDDKSYVNYMSEIGSLYLFNSEIKHTAINAGRTDRIHLVFSTV